jgi:asparagine synthase (glutamine-hydrolysing)
MIGNGLCGWTGTPPSGVEPEAALARMASGLSPVREGDSYDLAEVTHGLHVGGWRGTCHLEAGNQVWAAIEGCPRWSSPDLAVVAREMGHAAALKRAYREHGKELFQFLQGPFALAVLDRPATRALLAIDRFAVHTMCYAPTSSGGLVFGSTTDAVRAQPSVTSTIAPQAIYNFLYFYMSPSPGTIYREQRKLLPAEYLWFENGVTETGFYWHMPYQEEAIGRQEDLAEELKHLLDQAMGRVLAEANPQTLGAFLSGGLDSSTVAGLLHLKLKDRPKTFTIGFEHDRHDESSYARIAARYFDTEHHEYVLTPTDALEAIPKIVESYDEPFANSSAIPVYCCARLARDNGVELMLAGDGGDELFAGNQRYVNQKVYDLYHRLPQSLRSGLVEPLAFNTRLGDWWPFSRALSYISRARLAVPDRLATYNYFEATDASEIFETEILAQIDPGEPIEMLRNSYYGAKSRYSLHRMLHLDLKTTLADNDLRKVSRMCNLAGLRVRYPFLDEDLAALSARIPPSLAIKSFKIRYFYKKALVDFLPVEVLAKKKHGFRIPFEEWIKEDAALSELARDSLLAFKRRGYMRGTFIDRMINAHENRRPNPYDGLVFDIMMLELWMQSHTPILGDRVAV